MPLLGKYRLSIRLSLQQKYEFRLRIGHGVSYTRHSLGGETDAQITLLSIQGIQSADFLIRRLYLSLARWR